MSTLCSLEVNCCCTTHAVPVFSKSYYVCSGFSVGIRLFKGYIFIGFYAVQGSFLLPFLIICSYFISGFGEGKKHTSCILTFTLQLNVYVIVIMRNYHVHNFYSACQKYWGCWPPVFDILVYTLLLTIVYLYTYYIYKRHDTVYKRPDTEACNI